MIHTASLEVSKALDKAGIKIDTEWWWCSVYNNWELRDKKEAVYVPQGQGDMEVIPAPTLGELVRELPDAIRDNTGKVEFSLHITKRWSKHGYYDKNPYWVGYQDLEYNIKYAVEANTPENAAGKMLLEINSAKN